ncbi:hypothetical protein KK137_05995 [Croceibacterium sp. LX-88]|uniref:Lipoprotein n=1 Tax=Croceibacterium selenioxidans TaxID=2838833 RepID=A0ABS5W2A2_9SPHN|nr:hypothetical protein [Croceibacterium selenioxidans]MBT2133880.1 hypothetical protein [Croceibacterium selenioxidans]
MKRLVFAAILLGGTLAACDQAAEESDEPETITAADIPPSETSTAGTYQVTLADGTKGTSTLAEDGRYVDRFGGQTEEGNWAEVDGKTCFDPDEGGAITRCYVLGETAADGTFVATPDTGDPVTVKKVS